MPTIRVDDKVYAWLQSLARPFEDNPNSVLRRVAALDTASRENPNGKGEGSGQVGVSRPNGKRLKEQWGVNVLHALYHRDGMFYENLKAFPGALFDSHGYVIFHTEEEYQGSPYLSIGRKLNVHTGISSIPGYKRMG